MKKKKKSKRPHLPPGIRVMDYAGPGDDVFGVVIATDDDRVVFRVDSGDAKVGSLWTCEWETVGICPDQRGPSIGYPEHQQAGGKWAALLDLFADDPMIHPLLLAMQKAAGKAPPLIWLAAALYHFDNPGDEIHFQECISHVLAQAAGQVRHLQK